MNMERIDTPNKKNERKKTRGKMRLYTFVVNAKQMLTCTVAVAVAMAVAVIVKGPVVFNHQR